MEKSLTRSHAIIIGGLLLMICICALLNTFFKPIKNEMVRQTSPNGKYDAVVLSVAGSSDSSYWICIVDKGESRFDRPVFEVSEGLPLEKLNVSWKGEKLRIQVPEGDWNQTRLPSIELKGGDIVEVTYW